MIHHIILIRFKPGTPQADIDTAGRELLALKTVIPEIKRIHWSPNQAASAPEYPWVLLVLCADMAAVKRYLENPTHVEVVNRYLAPIREARLALDFEAA